MNSTRIVNLNATANAAGVALGAKAANLIQMARIGLPIPPGFCIPAAIVTERGGP